MPFILLQNQNITPGTRWILRPGPDTIPKINYIAQIREFDTEMQARQFSQANEGVFVGGKPWVLLFAGVADNTRCPITLNHNELVREFLQEAAGWLQANG